MNVKPQALLAVVVAAAMAAGCSKKKPSDAPRPKVEAAQAAASAVPNDAGIAWRHAEGDADVDAAFAAARAQGKPVFVYWGASWCPPCNQVKATLFNRQDFIQRSRAFVPVYVDGDSAGAQRLGQRFKVRGYPTMLLFTPDGNEVTRLPGEVDSRRYTEVLTLGLDARRPVKQLAATALAGGDAAKALTADDWRLLSFYSWETDEQQVVDPAHRPQLLKTLAAGCPAQDQATSARLMLVAAAASDDKSVDEAARARLLALLADPAASQAQMDVLANNAPAIVRATSRAGTPDRTQLLAAYDATLQRFEHDTGLSRADRMLALAGRVGLARIDLSRDAPAGRLPAPLLEDLRALAARFDREIVDGYERQAVITVAAETLQDAGLDNESDQLLKANLARSHSPFYLMSDLSDNARRRGDKEQALYWSREAFNTSMGPATRLQWGASYVALLVDLAPQDEAAIEKASKQVFDEAGGQSGAFYERSGRSMKKIGTRLQAWNQGGAHQAAITRLQSHLDGICRQLSGEDAATQRAVCDGVLKPNTQSPPAIRS